VNDLDVRDVPEQRRFEARRDAEVVGWIDYRIDGSGAVLLTHAEVPRRFEGQGVGTEMVTKALDQLDERGREYVPVCGFVASVARSR
jgi:predicted GNAT family acetyltransferase